MPRPTDIDAVADRDLLRSEKLQPIKRSPVICLIRYLLLGLWLAGAQLAFAAPERGDLTALPFEELLAMEVISAARLAKQVSDAPSAVSVVTAREIRLYGYRSLADILNGMRGLYVTHAPFYALLGGRGFGDPSDLAGRVTLLINGYKALDNFWGQSFFGSESLLDVELIERVEFIPGPGSSSHGDSAFLGVINVVTRSGQDIDGLTVSREWGSRGWQKARLTYGKRFASGLDLVVSASDYGKNGRTPFENSRLRYEDETSRRYFVQAAYQEWRLEGGWVNRTNYFLDGRYSDESSYVSLKHDASLAEGLKVSTHAYWGQSLYTADDDTFNWGTRGAWTGLDVKLVDVRHNRHTLVVGAEYRNDYRQQLAFDGWAKWRFGRKTVSLYAYDDILLAPSLQLNAGVRLDRRNNGSQTVSPRGAIIYTPNELRTFKLSTGVAHRQPSQDIEAFAPAGDFSLVARLQTTEVVWEERFAPQTRLIASVYRYREDNSYGWESSGNFVSDTIRAQGVEAEFEHAWSSGAHIRASYATQKVLYGGWKLVNVPRRVAKLNFSLPLVGEQLNLGTALRYVSDRHVAAGKAAAGGVITDLTLSGKGRGYSFAFSVRNAFNKVYPEVTRDGLYPIDGRNYWLQLNVDLK